MCKDVEVEEDGAYHLGPIAEPGATRFVVGDKRISAVRDS
jgi:hypothetical protein